MLIIQKVARFAAITVSGIFVALNLLGMFGVWLVERRTIDITLKGFGLVEAAVGVVDVGVARVDDLLSTSRTEVRQAAETMTTVGSRAAANRPVLRALSERLETSLAPRIAQIRQALAPVRDAVGMISHTVSLLNSLPTMADRAPRLAALDDSFKRLEELSLDTMQLRSTLRALVDAQTSDLSDETIATINGLTQRIDSRLGEVQANVQGVQAEIAALKVRLDVRKSRLLFVYNLLTLLVTLMLAWILYSQIIVIRHHRLGTSVRGDGRDPSS
jgi:hypothetical protein